ncbi:hypothetical protein LTR28_009893 [Elasticomyces elasticus]|nr:hypothetical protein LTR28_009893 [Elasticomyces elasticus]
MKKWKKFTRRPRGDDVQRTPEESPVALSIDEEQAATQSTFARPTSSNVADVFPEGIIELHACDNPIVDVCFVHGLTGDREETWTAKGQEKSWPQLLLPAHLKQARILSWGYDAYVMRRSVASSNRLIDHATNLLNDLTTDRSVNNASTRSLIFVAHSLGGLVCKQAILISKDNPEPHLKGLFQYTKAIAFMGTPHTGSWMASWARMPASILGILKSANKSLLSVLQIDDQLLESIQIGFLSLVRDLRDNQNRRLEVTCFFEELGMPTVGIVVSKESATFAGYNPVSIHANHSDMVKFAVSNDNGFIRVLGELRRWESELRYSLQGRVITMSGIEAAN